MIPKIENRKWKVLTSEKLLSKGTWQLFMTCSPNPTNHTNLSYTFLATGVEKVCEQHQETTEDIHVDVFTRDEVLELLATRQVIQALHLAPLYKYFATCGRE